MYLAASLHANIFCHLHIVPKNLGGDSQGRYAVDFVRVERRRRVISFR